MRPEGHFNDIMHAARTELKDAQRALALNYKEWGATYEFSRFAHCDDNYGPFAGTYTDSGGWYEMSSQNLPSSWISLMGVHPAQALHAPLK
jgi:hypothetical protein